MSATDYLADLVEKKDKKKDNTGAIIGGLLIGGPLLYTIMKQMKGGN